MTTEGLRELLFLLDRIDLKALREERQISVATMAAWMDCERMNIWKIEKNRNPTLLTLSRYLGALDAIESGAPFPHGIPTKRAPGTRIK